MSHEMITAIQGDDLAGDRLHRDEKAKRMADLVEGGGAPQGEPGAASL